MQHLRRRGTTANLANDARRRHKGEATGRQGRVGVNEITLCCLVDLHRLATRKKHGLTAVDLAGRAIVIAFLDDGTSQVLVILPFRSSSFGLGGRRSDRVAVGGGKIQEDARA